MRESCDENLSRHKFQHALPIRECQITLPSRSVRYARYATLLWNICDFRDLHAEFCILQDAQLTIAQTRIRTHASLSMTKRSRRWNKFEFPMPSVKFPYQCPDYICITVHGRPTTRDDEKRRVRTCKNARERALFVIIPE